MKPTAKKKQMSVNLPMEQIERVKQLAKEHGVNRYDYTSANQMFSILIGLGIDAYLKLKDGK